MQERQFSTIRDPRHLLSTWDFFLSVQLLSLCFCENIFQEGGGWMEWQLLFMSHRPVLGHIVTCSHKGVWSKCSIGHIVSPDEVGILVLLSHFSRVRLCATPQTAAHQAPPSLGFSRQEYWSGLPFTSPGILVVGNKGRVYIVQQLTLSSSVVWTPEEDENELVALLQNRGLFKLFQKMSWH